MNFLHISSIKNKLAMLILFAVMPCLAILLYSGLEQRRERIETAKSDVSLLTRTMAEAQKGITQSTKQILSTLSLLPAIQSGDASECNPLFRAMLEQNPNFDNIALVDLSGQVIASGKTFTEINLADRKHVKEALAKKDFAVGEYIITRVGTANPAFTFAYPVLDKEDNLRNILTAAIKLDVFAGFYDVTTLPEKSFLAVTDHNGIRMFYYPAQKNTNPIGQPIQAKPWNIASNGAREGLFFASGSDGLRRILAYEKLYLSDESTPYLYVWTGIPENHIIRPANAALTRNVLLLILATVVSLLISWAIGRKTLISPIQLLVTLTRKFSQGDFEARIEQKTQTGEIAILTEAFHNMAKTLAEKTQLEEQYRQTQKMEAIGQLAGGVAHDFNNMLGVILGYAELALTEVDQSHPLYNKLKEIEKAALRSADITRQLLAFARKQTIEPKVLNLNETVEGMLKMLRRLIGEDINLTWQPGDDLWPVKVDPAQIDLVLVNLCINGRDAIAGIGRMTVQTENSILSEEYCAAHTECVPGEYVRMTVTDSGCGIDKLTLSQIFEPFFTTKGVGEGTGLGLATVFGAVRQNNGFINVSSGLGLGTSFTIYLPRYHGDTKQADKELAPPPVMRGKATILLVEDEAAILSMTMAMLKKLGYAVLPAGSPEEAIRRAADFFGEIDMLMTDVIMPGLNGRDLADLLLEDYPQMRCLFMSGYTADIISNHEVLDKDVYFLQKPFAKKDLAVKLRQVLENKPEGYSDGELCGT
jgi:signal transduction histidine kinase/CheY-like chemotaxis protein